MGEFGASDRDNDEDRARWTTHYLSCAKEVGIPCFWWDSQKINGDMGFECGMLHRKSGTWFEDSVPILKAIMELYGIEGDIPVYEYRNVKAFSWDKISVEKDWENIYYSEQGEWIDSWSAVYLEGVRKYLNDAYEIIVVFDSHNSVQEVNLRMGNGWYRVQPDSYIDNPYMSRFTMDDINLTLETAKENLRDISDFFVATEDTPVTLYGVYAVPVR